MPVYTLDGAEGSPKTSVYKVQVSPHSGGTFEERHADPRAWMRRSRKWPMFLADACLLRLSEPEPAGVRSEQLTRRPVSWRPRLTTASCLRSPGPADRSSN